MWEQSAGLLSKGKNTQVDCSTSDRFLYGDDQEVRETLEAFNKYPLPS